MIAVLPFVVVTAVLVSIYFYFFNRVEEAQNETEYTRYYAFITSERDSEFFRSIYEGALAAGKERGFFVEYMGENLSQDYSVADLLRIATASRVDGIILEAENNGEASGDLELAELIDAATNKGIPVVTLGTDSANSRRVSFVGVSSYNLGREYANRIKKIVKGEKNLSEACEVLVLIDSSTADPAQNIVCSAMKEALEQKTEIDRLTGKVDFVMYPIDGTNTFSVEESVRKLFMERLSDLPDIIVCLNEKETTSVYQAVVDYNRVGDVRILGNYDSITILNAIKRNVIDSAIRVDTQQMGRFCIDALSEYDEYGNTSQYFTADITLIDTSNVNLYLKEGE